MMKSKIASTLSILALAGCGGGGGSGSTAAVEAITNEIISPIEDSLDSLSPVDSNSPAEQLAPTEPATPESRSATLSWDPPEMRDDGAELNHSELSGYVIYYTSENDTAGKVITIEDPDVFEYEITDLEPDTYFFTIAAYDFFGQESDQSVMQTKTIN